MAAQAGPREASAEHATLEERLRPSGLSVADVRRFLSQAKLAFAAEGCAAVAELVAYPYLLEGSPDLGRITREHVEPAGPRITTPAEFIEQCDVLVTQEVREAVRRQEADELSANWAGVMIGHGEVWFTGVCADPACKSYEVRIVRINAGR